MSKEEDGNVPTDGGLSFIVFSMLLKHMKNVFPATFPSCSLVLWSHEIFSFLNLYCYDMAWKGEWEIFAINIAVSLFNKQPAGLPRIDYMPFIFGQLVTSWGF